VSDRSISLQVNGFQATAILPGCPRASGTMRASARFALVVIGDFEHHVLTRDQPFVWKAHAFASRAHASGLDRVTDGSSC
jgi:hypothetical protein